MMWAMIAVQHHRALEYRDRAIDQFEQLYSDAKDRRESMALVAHPYLMGVPHRLRYFERRWNTFPRGPGSCL